MWTGPVHRRPKKYGFYSNNGSKLNYECRMEYYPRQQEDYAIISTVCL